MKKTITLTLLAATLLSPAIAQRQGGGGGGGQAVATSIASATQNFTKKEGFFNFYTDEKTGRVLLEIDKFNTEFLYFGSLVDGVGNGGPERGQATSFLVKFIKMGPKVFMVEPNDAYRAVGGNADEVKDVENAFAKSVIFNFNTVAVEGDKVLVDFTPFILRDALKLGDALGSGRGNPGAAQAAGGRGAGAAGGGGAYRVDELRSAVVFENTKN